MCINCTGNICLLDPTAHQHSLSYIQHELNSRSRRAEQSTKRFVISDDDQPCYYTAIYNIFDITPVIVSPTLTCGSEISVKLHRVGTPDGECVALFLAMTGSYITLGVRIDHKVYQEVQ